MKKVPTVLSVLDLDPRKFGSMEEFTAALSRTLSNRQCRSVVVFSESFPEHVLPWFQDSGAIVESFNHRLGASFYLRLRELVHRYRPDVLHFHFYEQFSLIPFWAALLGVKSVFFTDHCRQPLKARPTTQWKLKLWNRLIPPLLGTTTITISEHMKRLLVSDFFMNADDIKVVLNGINPVRFKPLSQSERERVRLEYSVPSGRFVVATAAALIPEKGIGDFLLAGRQILQQEPRAFFLVAGDGAMEKELKETSNALGLSGHINFVGLVADISSYLASADVIVIPSVWQEPAGLLVIESMACGRPVVATRVGGIPEYLTDAETGVLVDPKRPDLISAAVLNLLRSPELSTRLGSAARKHVEEKFTTEKWVENTLQLYGPEFQASESILRKSSDVSAVSSN